MLEPKTHIFARVSRQGTACAETALCNQCFTPANRRAKFRNPATMTGNDAPQSDYVDCSGNTVLECNDCGFSLFKPTVPTNAELIAKARTEYQREGSIEIDDGAVVSRGSDEGAYVQAWVWVEFQ